jgi:hypothetical protein
MLFGTGTIETIPVSNTAGWNKVITMPKGANIPDDVFDTLCNQHTVNANACAQNLSGKRCP